MRTCEYAAEGPDVDGHAVSCTEDDLRCAVEAGLDVGVDALVLVARRAEVDHLQEIREGGVVEYIGLSFFGAFNVHRLITHLLHRNIYQLLTTYFGTGF